MIYDIPTLIGWASLVHAAPGRHHHERDARRVGRSAMATQHCKIDHVGEMTVKVRAATTAGDSKARTKAVG